MSNQIINPCNIQPSVSAKDWRDAMRLSGKLLVDSGYITEEYIDLAINCVEENGPYIVIMPGIALSHYRPHPSVLKTGVSLIILSEPINFNCDNDPVSVVLTLASQSDEAHLEILGVMADVLSDEDKFESLKSCSTPEEVLKIFC